jgi:hypothetical protein
MRLQKRQVSPRPCRMPLLGQGFVFFNRHATPPRRSPQGQLTPATFWGSVSPV